MLSEKVTAPEFLLKAHGLSTQRQWRQMKRAEMDAVLRALDTFRYGCAYCPGSDDREIDALFTLAETVRERMSQKNWGK